MCIWNIIMLCDIKYHGWLQGHTWNGFNDSLLLIKKNCLQTFFNTWKGKRAALTRLIMNNTYKISFRKNFQMQGRLAKSPCCPTSHLISHAIAQLEQWKYLKKHIKCVFKQSLPVMYVSCNTQESSPESLCTWNEKKKEWPKKKNTTFILKGLDVCNDVVSVCSICTLQHKSGLC